MPPSAATAATYAAAGSFAQTYDRAANVTADSRSLAGVAGDAGSGTASYTYDALRRLTGASGVGGTRTYTYDRDGNRLSRSEPGLSASYAYDRTDQLTGQTLNATPGAFTYDGRGNLTNAATSAMTQTSYSYDLGERLTAIRPASGSPATFSFDSLGRPATRVVGSSTDSYSYLGSTSTVAGISTAGVMTASLLDPDGSRLVNKDLSSAAATFSLPDLHGSLAAAQLTGSTTIAVAYRYDAYGQTLASGGAGGGPDQPYRYQGRLDLSPDAAEPLYAAGARAYQPSLGVFTQLDSHPGSAQDPLSLNRYLYAEANPTSLIDPDGHAAMANAGVGAELDAAVMSAVLQQFAQAAAAQTAQRKAAAAAAQAAAAKQYILSHDSGSQLIGVGKGFVEGFVGAAIGTGQLVLETGWTAYHSTVAYATDRDAFNAQWDTNRAVGTYVWNHPLETGGALVGGLVGGTLDKLAHGNVGEAIGEVGGQLAFFGGVAKVVSLARGAAGIERTVAAAEEGAGGIGPVLQGQAGVEKSIAAAQARGESVIGREITMETTAGRTRPDLLVRDAEGNLKFIESKNGPFARLTPNQSSGFPLLESEGGIPRGLRALEAGLTPGDMTGPIPVRIDWWGQ